MKHMAAYLMLVLGGNENPTADDVSTALSSVGVETDSEQLGKLRIYNKSANLLIDNPYLAEPIRSTPILFA